jgi:hypothetical protein
MSATVFHAIATQFKARYLNPLQFPGSNRSVEDRVSDLENARTGRQTQSTSTPLHTDEHFDKVMARSADLLERTKRPQSTSWGEEMGQRLGAKHDRVEAADHARLLHRSGDILQNIRNTAAEHRAAAPLPEERHADNMSRTGEALDRIRATQASLGPSTPPPAPRPTAAPARTAQIGMFPKSEVRQPQQFTLAATEGPRPQRSAGAPAAPKPRVTRPKLFQPSDWADSLPKK